MTGEEAAGRAAAVLAERDAIQANLLELDGSFARRLLDGAALTGQTRQRWDAASAALAGLWETYQAYSAVVDRVAALAGGGRRTARRERREPEELTELTGLLTGAPVLLARGPAPLARRDLTDAGREQALTLAVAVAAMRQAFTEVAEVTSAVEAVLEQAAERRDRAAAELTRIAPLLAGLGAEIDADVRDVRSSLEALRTEVTADPLARWHGGRADTSAEERLLDRAAGIAARVAGLDQLRQTAQRRLDALTAAVARARAERAEAVAEWRHAATRIAGPPPLPREIAEPPAERLAALAAGGQWTGLQAALTRCEAELADAAARTGDLRRFVATLLGRREELRGLLGAYQAKAARLGQAEDADLTARYDTARDLLWTAPCDLVAAGVAVNAYQQAILAAERRQR